MQMLKNFIENMQVCVGYCTSQLKAMLASFEQKSVHTMLIFEFTF